MKLAALIVILGCGTSLADVRDAVVRIGGMSGVSVGQGVVLSARHGDFPNSVVVAFRDGRRLKATKVCESKEYDGAVAFRLEQNGDVPSATVSLDPVKKSDKVFSIGYPKGVMRVGIGVVESDPYDHDTKMGEQHLGTFEGIDTSIPVDFGWSGGPLFNERHEVVGVLSAGGRDPPGSIFVGHKIIRRIYEVASAKPHLRVFTMNNCRPCALWKADYTAGKFAAYEVEVLRVPGPGEQATEETAKNLKTFYDTIAAIRKAKGRIDTGRDGVVGLPMFHVAGKAYAKCGYGGPRPWEVLLKALKDTAMFLPDLVTSIIDRSDVATPVPIEHALPIDSDGSVPPPPFAEPPVDLVGAPEKFEREPETPSEAKTISDILLELARAVKERKDAKDLSDKLAADVKAVQAAVRGIKSMKHGAPEPKKDGEPESLPAYLLSLLGGAVLRVGKNAIDARLAA